jgi:hypothetical protein
MFRSNGRSYDPMRIHCILYEKSLTLWGSLKFRALMKAAIVPAKGFGCGLMMV